MMTSNARAAGRRTLAGFSAACLLLPTAAATTATLLAAPTAAYAQSGTTNHVGAGTQVKVKLLRDISSSTAQVGDTVRAVVASDDKSGLPAGTEFIGHVVNVKPATPRDAGVLDIDFSLPNGDSYRGRHDDGGNANYNPGGYGNGNGNGNGNGDPNDNGAPRDDQGYNGNGNSNGNGGGYDAPAGPSIATAALQGTTYKGSGHSAGIAAGAGALLGFVRKRKLGDLLEGGAIGGVAGTAADQLQRRGASDVQQKKGSEITIKLNRPLVTRMMVVPDESQY